MNVYRLYQWGIIIILISFIAIVCGCGIKLPEFEPTIVGYWTNDFQNASVEFYEDGAYSAVYGNQQSFGKWEVVGKNMYKFSEDVLCKGRVSIYSILYMSRYTLKLRAESELCTQRQDTWEKTMSRRF